MSLGWWVGLLTTTISPMGVAARSLTPCEVFASFITTRHERTDGEACARVCWSGPAAGMSDDKVTKSHDHTCPQPVSGYIVYIKYCGSKLRHLVLCTTTTTDGSSLQTIFIEYFLYVYGN